MKVKSSESVRVYRTSASGCEFMIALAFIGLGLIPLYLGIIFLWQGGEAKSWIAAGVSVFFGIAILSVAIPKVFVRQGVTLDRIDGTATEWKSILGRHKNLAVHNLNEFRAIEIHSHEIPRRRIITYIVQLTGESKKIVLSNLPLLELTQEIAKDASAFLSLPLLDKSSAEEDFLDEPM